MFQTLSVHSCRPHTTKVCFSNHSSICSVFRSAGCAQAYRITELEFALNKVECRALITATRHKHSDYMGMIQTLAPEMAGAPAPGQLQCARLPVLKTVIQARLVWSEIQDKS
jgi:hypothetical protein